jgi:hypothetical protein
VRKHFSDIPRSNADTDTKPDADAYTHADASADAYTDAHANADTQPLAWANECHDNGEPEPGVADKSGRGRLRREHAQSVGMGADPREQGLDRRHVQPAHQFLQRLAGQRSRFVGDAVARRTSLTPDTVV